MRTRLVYWWDVLRDKLWFIPSLFCLASLALATATLSIDRAFDLSGMSLLTSLETTGSSARIVLGALIGALVTVVGLAFSLTMLSVSQTASQYGPRLIRTLFDSNVTQNTLGLFLGTIVYCMIVLRSIRDLESSGELFTPNLSILLAELSSAACLFGLLKLTSHMTRCLRAETLIEGIYADLLSASETVFPESVTNESKPSIAFAERANWQQIEGGLELQSTATGYLQAIDLNNLLERAQHRNHRVQLEKRPGEFVHEGSQLARIECAPADAEQASQWRQMYHEHFLLGLVRTPRQDIEAGVVELVEAGVRALSPGVNDPVTAINVIDYVATFMRQLAQRPWPGGVMLDARGTPRVYTKPMTFESVLNAGFDPLRQYAAGSVAVYISLLDGLAAITAAASRRDDLAAIRRQGEMVLRSAERNIEESLDLQDVQRSGRRLLDLLDDAQRT